MPKKPDHSANGDELAQWRVLIADDEPLVRRGLRRVLDAEPDFVVVGEARNGSEALEMIRSRQPDLLMIDVHMPSRDGFTVLASLPPEVNPVVVFVTAHEEYAVRAFDVAAADYLLKPFDPDRARLALARARRLLEKRSSSVPGSQDAGAPGAQPDRIDHLLAKDRGRVHVVPIATITHLEARGNYVVVHTTRGAHRIRSTLGALHSRLGPDFERVHRSTIVALSQVRALRPLPHGENEIELASGEKVILSRTHRDEFRVKLARQRG